MQFLSSGYIIVGYVERCQYCHPERIDGGCILGNFSHLLVHVFRQLPYILRIIITSHVIGLIINFDFGYLFRVIHTPSGLVKALQACFLGRLLEGSQVLLDAPHTRANLQPLILQLF